MTATEWAKRYGVDRKVILRIGVEQFAAATEEARRLWLNMRRGLTPEEAKVARERISAEDRASGRRERVMWAHLARTCVNPKRKKPARKADAIRDVLYWLGR